MEQHQISTSGDPHASDKRSFIVEYFRGAFSEIRKVTWPSRKETWKKAWIVVGFSLAFAIFLGTLDYLLNILLEIAL